MANQGTGVDLKKLPSNLFFQAGRFSEVFHSSYKQIYAFDFLFLLRKMKRSDQPLPEDGVKKAEMLRLSRHSFEKIQECEVIEAHYKRQGFFVTVNSETAGFKSVNHSFESLNDSVKR